MNFTKLLLITVLIILFSKSNFSQQFKGGYIVGFSGSQIHGDNGGGYNKLNLYGGAFVKIPYKKNFIVSEIAYSGKGSRISNSQTNYVYKISFQYAVMPVYFQYNFNKKYFTDVGISPAYMFYYRISENGYTQDKDLYNISPFNISALLGFGYNVKKSGKLSVRFMYSVFPVTMYPAWYNNEILLSYTKTL